MFWPLQALQKLTGVFRRPSLERQMEEEMRTHLALQADAHRAAGVNREEALFLAQKEFGHLEGIKEQLRDLRGLRWIEDAVQDFRIGVRQLGRSRGFCALAIGSLSCSMGIWIAVFCVTDGVLLRPGSQFGGDTLVAIGELLMPPADQTNAPPRAFREWRAGARSFLDLAAYRIAVGNAAEWDETGLILRHEVTSNLFPMLEARPLLGRTFNEADESAETRVAVLSHAYWITQLAGRRDVLGQTILLNGRAYTVVGVMPRDFQPLPSRHAVVYVPMMPAPREKENGPTDFQILARLKAGVSVATALLELQTISRRVAASAPGTQGEWQIQIVSIFEESVRNPRWILLVLLGSASSLLAMSVINIANLQAARACGRKKEFAVRVALGAGRRRLLCQVFSESLLIAVISGILGGCLAYFIVKRLGGWALIVPSTSPIEFAAPTFAAAVALVLLAALACSVPSALASLRVPVQLMLKADHSGLNEGTVPPRLRNLLVGVQVFLALVLVVISVSLAGGFHRLRNSARGFEAEGLYRTRMVFDKRTHVIESLRVATAARLVDRLAGDSRFEHLAFTTAVPFGGPSRRVLLANPPALLPGAPRWANFACVSPEYFETLGISILRGRAFEKSDRSGMPSVAIINEELARQRFPQVDPVGQTLILAESPRNPLTVVGVTGNTAFNALGGAPWPQVYRPYAQFPDDVLSAYAVYRPRRGVTEAEAALVQAIHQIDPDVEVGQSRSVGESLRASFQPQGLAVLTIGFAAAAAVGLAMVGVYGMVSHSVRQREFEIGVRRALGAQPRHIYQTVLRQSASAAGLGLLAGIPGGWVASRVLGSFFGQNIHADPFIISGIVVLVAAVAFLAGWLPARHAVRVAPQSILRHP